MGMLYEMKANEMNNNKESTSTFEFIKNYIGTKTKKFAEKINSVELFQQIRYFFKGRLFQESLIIGSFIALLFKISYLLIFECQCLWYHTILIFVMTILFNTYYDIYGLYIRENIYKKIISIVSYNILFPLDLSSFYNDYDKKISAKNNIFSSFFEQILLSLVFIRLCILAEPILFSVIRFIVVYCLLFNKLLTIVYILSFYIILSRVVFHLTDYNMNSIRGSYKHIYQSLIPRFSLTGLPDEDIISIRPTIKNAKIFLLWIFRCEGTDLINEDYDMFKEYKKSSRKKYIRLFLDDHFRDYSNFNDASSLKVRGPNIGIFIDNIDILYKRNQSLYECIIHSCIFFLSIYPFILGSINADFAIVYLDPGLWVLKSSYSSSLFRFFSALQKQTRDPIIQGSEITSNVETAAADHPSIFKFDNGLLKQFTSGTKNPTTIRSNNLPLLLPGNQNVLWTRGTIYIINPDKENFVKNVLNETERLSNKYPIAELESIKNNVEYVPVFLMTHFHRQQAILEYFDAEFDFNKKSEEGYLLPDSLA